jgi:hypothetical protein
MSRDDSIPHVVAEPVAPRPADQLQHLAAHRGLIVRRALLIGAIRAFLPVPVLDERLAGRVRAGLLAKLASGRQVDLPPASAVVLGNDESKGASLTLAAGAALLAKFAGRKLFALVAAGYGADEMARNFYRATLFDHYCAKLHVGGPITQTDAAALRRAIESEMLASGSDPVLAAFREGSRILGRSLLEAPRWFSQRIAAMAERFARTGGNPDVLDAVPETPDGDDTWIERAGQAVEAALAHTASAHLAKTVDSFAKGWQAGR